MKRLVLFVILLAVVVSMLPAVAHAGAGEPLPRAMRVTAPLSGVSCMGPCCCGEVLVIWHGHYYGNPSYCKWFAPLRNGQNVTTNVTLRR